MTAETMTNWGPCSTASCKSHYVPRCASNLCLFCCMKAHDEWLGHMMADGKPSTATIRTKERAKQNGTTYVSPDERLPAKYQETKVANPPPPPPPAEPEPGKMKELQDEPIIVPTPDNSYIGDRGGKSGFPITYAK